MRELYSHRETRYWHMQGVDDELFVVVSLVNIAVHYADKYMYYASARRPRERKVVYKWQRTFEEERIKTQASSPKDNNNTEVFFSCPITKRAMEGKGKSRLRKSARTRCRRPKRL